MTHPVPTDSFLQPSQEVAMLSQFAAQMAVHGPTKWSRVRRLQLKQKLLWVFNEARNAMTMGCCFVIAPVCLLSTAPRVFESQLSVCSPKHETQALSISTAVTVWWVVWEWDTTFSCLRSGRNIILPSSEVLLLESWRNITMPCATQEVCAYFECYVPNIARCS